MRLELSVRTDLALRALRNLANSEQRVGRPELADALETTPDFLARVMGPLVSQGWVDSRPGRNGGYELTEAGRGVSVLDVIQVEEGVPVERCVLRFGPCNPDERCALHDPWMKARDAMLAELATASATGGWKESR
ncbi:MAG: Rrf2 family transcriptional regulator [Acidimicrobiia bacterium]|jgi:Rrf2 family protein